MSCSIPYCSAEAVGLWRWPVPSSGGVAVVMALCDEHWRQKVRSRAPGRFERDGDG